ncbi:MAG: hypothetical protein AAF600_21720 [Bacteroidota bacterium]
MKKKHPVESMPLLRPRAAGIDVGSRSHDVAMPGSGKGGCGLWSVGQ